MKKIEKVFLRRLKHSDILYDLLCLGAGFAVTAVPALGVAAIFAKVMLKNGGKYSDNKLRESFYFLRKKGLISFEKVDGKISFQLTESGIKNAELAKLRLILKGKTGNKWKGAWYLVIFDIPSEKRNARDALRFLLKRLGFAQMQKSVWICPFNCRKEVEYLRDFFMLNAHELRIIASDDIGDDKKFRSRFKI